MCKAMLHELLPRDCFSLSLLSLAPNLEPIPHAHGRLRGIYFHFISAGKTLRNGRRACSCGALKNHTRPSRKPHILLQHKRKHIMQEGHCTTAGKYTHGMHEDGQTPAHTKLDTHGGRSTACAPHSGLRHTPPQPVRGPRRNVGSEGRVPNHSAACTCVRAKGDKNTSGHTRARTRRGRGGRQVRHAEAPNHATPQPSQPAWAPTAPPQGTHDKKTQQQSPSPHHPPPLLQKQGEGGRREEGKV